MNGCLTNKKLVKITLNGFHNALKVWEQLQSLFSEFVAALHNIYLFGCSRGN